MVDDAHVLPPAAAADLTAKLEALQKDTHRQLVVATVKDLQGRDIADYGYRLGRSWGVGLRDVDNGAVLIVAPTEHQVRIEVGRGLEPVLTDAWSSETIRTTITPRFKAGDLPGGILAGVDAIGAQLRAAPEEAQARLDAAAKGFDQQHQRRRSSGGGGGVPIGLIFWGVVLLFVVLPAFGRRRWGGRRWS
ncbi:TPM domain-containing protein, partial [Sphingomonas bacterium]|uniref:TPM domain-containing protein n=1 Tax=Sphingomonas bacterium TaxID=1895847 RepID=UPI0020C65B8A